MTNLWISNRGEVVCGKSPLHGGSYLASAIKNLSQHQTQISTPLDHWMLVSESVAEEFELECEACAAEKSARPHPLPMGVKQAEGG